MPGRFVDQVAIVTAGGSGIGAATARRFAGEGASVVVADLSGTRAEAVASGIAIYCLADGKVVEQWLEYDQLGLLQQLGVIPTMG